MDSIKLSVHERQETGNGPARRLRAKGLVPAVSYAKGRDATSIALDVDELKAAMAHGHNVVLELVFDKGAQGEGGKTKGRYAVVKKLQFHPVKRYLQHVDLHEVDLAVEIESPVAIEPVGTPAGLIDGGVIDWERREVVVRALPGNMPASLELDISGLVIGHHLTVAALAAPTGVTIVDDPEAMLVALVPPRVEVPTAFEAAAEAAAAEAAEPEVIGAKPTEE
jgi:large subunit ribosomal protein L25